MDFIDFSLKHPEINTYINRLEEKFSKNGIRGFHGHNLLVVGGNKTERLWSTLYTPFKLRNFILEHLEKDVSVCKRHITCTNKSVKRIESEIFKTLKRQILKNSVNTTGGLGVYPKQNIELLTLFDIHKGMKSLLNKLAEELAYDDFLPPDRYRIGLVISTLKPGEKISSLPKPFVDLCVRHDLSKRKMATREEREEKFIHHDISQKIRLIKTTLSYYKTTGEFRYGEAVSLAVSPTSRAKVRNVAEKLMKRWIKGLPCPLSEFGIDPTKKTPTQVYDNISDIRKVLKNIEVNMPQCTEEGYHPPIEPESFNIISRKLD